MSGGNGNDVQQFKNTFSIHPSSVLVMVRESWVDQRQKYRCFFSKKRRKDYDAYSSPHRIIIIILTTLYSYKIFLIELLYRLISVQRKGKMVIKVLKSLFYVSGESTRKDKVKPSFCHVKWLPKSVVSLMNLMHGKRKGMQACINQFHVANDD